MNRVTRHSDKRLRLFAQRQKDKPAPTMSRLRGMEGHWRVPYDGTSKLERQFGEWRKIEFIPTPREGVPPVPSGTYEIRY